MSHLVYESRFLCVFCKGVILKQTSFFSLNYSCFRTGGSRYSILALKNNQVNLLFLACLCLSLQSNLRIIYIYEYNQACTVVHPLLYVAGE